MIYPDKVDNQIKEMDNENLLAIAKSIHKQGVVVFYNQKLNELEYINNMKRFGEDIPLPYLLGVNYAIGNFIGNQSWKRNC